MTTTAAVKERPILFSGPMVRAILEGRKTQTRRIVKPQPPSKDWLIRIKHTGQDVGLYNDNGRWRMTGAVGVCRDAMGDLWPKKHEWKCPYGSVGDRLWVRETFHECVDEDTREFVRWGYRADRDWDGAVWSPSIHMPRRASRITLEITGLKVERLNDISNEDCQAEGITAIGKGVAMPDGTYAQAGRYENSASTVRSLFSSLWESINGPGSWAANPWVWVVEFKRVSA